MNAIDILEDSNLFAGLQSSYLEDVVRLTRQRVFAPGSLLFRQGDPGDTMYIILSGRVRVFFCDAQERSVVFRYYAPGEIVGEFSLLDGEARSASADAEGEVETLMLSRSDFVALIHEHPLIGLKLMRSLAERVRYTTHFLEHMVECTEHLSSGAFEAAVQEASAVSSVNGIDALVRSFIHMARRVQEREAELSANG